MPLRVSLLRDRQALRSLATEWNDLLANSPADTIFLTWEWVSAWLESVAPSAPLLVVALRDDTGALVGIGPFYVTRMRLLGLLPYRVCRVLGDSHSGSEYPDVIVRQDVAEEATATLMRALIDCGDRWDCIWLPQMAGWTGGVERIRECCADLHLKCHARRRVFSSIALPGRYDAYVQSLSRKRRALVRRLLRIHAGEANVSVETCTSEKDREAYLNSLFALHRRRWNRKGEEGSFVRKPAMADFYRAFTALALSRGWLRILGLRVGSQFKALQIGYLRNKVFSALQEGFDPEADRGIGNLLRALSIRSLIEEGAERYDFLGGFTEHKRLWRAEVRHGSDVFIGRPNLRTRLLFHKEVWPFGRFIVEDHPWEQRC